MDTNVTSAKGLQSDAYLMDYKPASPRHTNNMPMTPPYCNELDVMHSSSSFSSFGAEVKSQQYLLSPASIACDYIARDHRLLSSPIVLPSAPDSWLPKELPSDDTPMFLYPLADHIHCDCGTTCGASAPESWAEAVDMTSLGSSIHIPPARAQLNNFATSTAWHDVYFPTQIASQQLLHLLQGTSEEHSIEPFVKQEPNSEDDGASFVETRASSCDQAAPDADEDTEEPYAKLIHRALMSSPDHSMKLQDLYEWFRQNTRKTDTRAHGWMNSIRHNLSMNAAFKRLDGSLSHRGHKKSTVWMLEDFAISHGVQSTTRYRKVNAAKRDRHRLPVVARQEAGARGGRSASASKQRIRQQQASERLLRGQQSVSAGQSRYAHRPLIQDVYFLPPSNERSPSGCFHVKTETIGSYITGSSLT